MMMRDGFDLSTDNTYKIVGTILILSRLSRLSNRSNLMNLVEPPSSLPFNSLGDNHCIPPKPNNPLQ